MIPLDSILQKARKSSYFTSAIHQKCLDSTKAGETSINRSHMCSGRFGHISLDYVQLTEEMEQFLNHDSCSSTPVNTEDETDEQEHE